MYGIKSIMVEFWCIYFITVYIYTVTISPASVFAAFNLFSQSSSTSNSSVEEKKVFFVMFFIIKSIQKWPPFDLKGTKAHRPGRMNATTHCPVCHLTQKMLVGKGLHVLRPTDTDRELWNALSGNWKKPVWNTSC